MAKLPLVSIIMPVYNRESIVEESIKSVISQTYQNWELIIIDDGSVDNTLTILENYADKYPNIKIFERKTKKKGASVCRNYGFSKSQGKFIVFLDSDDLLSPSCLSLRVESIIKYPKYDCLVFPGLIFKQKPFDTNIYISKDINVNEYLEEFLKFNAPFVNLNPIWGKNFLLKNKLFWDEKLKGYQDWDFHIRALLSCPKIKNLEDFCPDCFWRRFQESNHIGKGLDNPQNRINQFALFIKILKLISERRINNSHYIDLLLSNIFHRIILRQLENREKETLKFVLSQLKNIHEFNKIHVWAVVTYSNIRLLIGKTQFLNKVLNKFLLLFVPKYYLVNNAKNFLKIKYKGN